MAVSRDETSSEPGAVLFLSALAITTGAAWVARLCKDPDDLVGTNLRNKICNAGSQCLPPRLFGYDAIPWAFEVFGWTEGIPVEALEQLQRQSERLLAQAAHADAGPAALHLGAHESLAGLGQLLHGSWGLWRYRAVLAEPDCSRLPALRQRLQAVDPTGRGTGAYAVCAAVTAASSALPAASSPPATLHGVGPQLVQDMPLLGHVYRHLAKFRSPSREDAEAAIERECRKIHWLQNCASWREYVVETRSRSVAPAALLQEVGVDADAVFALFLDAIGGDVAVTREFLGMEGFSPLLVAFKHSQHSYEEVASLVRVLASKGFDVWMTALHIIAVKAEL